MKSYSEVIENCAKRMFSTYMGGGNDLRIPGVGVIAYIYGVPEAQVTRQIEQQYKKVRDEYYLRVNK